MKGQKPLPAGFSLVILVSIKYLCIVDYNIGLILLYTWYKTYLSLEKTPRLPNANKHIIYLVFDIYTIYNSSMIYT